MNAYQKFNRDFFQNQRKLKAARRIGKLRTQRKRREEIMADPIYLAARREQQMHYYYKRKESIDSALAIR